MSAVIGLSCAAGAALALLPARGSIALAGVAAAGGLLVVARIALAPTGTLRSVRVHGQRAKNAEPQERSGTDAWRFGFSRNVYYLGAATMGLLTVRPVLSFTLSDWLFLLSLGVTVIAILRTRVATELDILLGATFGAALFAFGGLISSVHAVQPLGSIAIVVRMLYLTLPWLWLGTVVLRTTNQVRNAVFAWVLSVAICGAGAVAQFLIGNVIPGGEIAYGRVTGFTTQFNNLGGLTAVAFVPGLMVAVSARGRMRIVAYAACTLIGAGLLLSGSLGGLLAAAVSTAVWIVAGRRSPKTLIILATLVAGALLLMGTQGTTNSPSPIERLTRATRSDAPPQTGGTLYTRVDLDRAAWNHISKQPFVGVGLDLESSAQRIGFQVHNIVLNPWFTAGIFGVTGILVLVGALMRAGLKVVQQAQGPNDHALAVALFASFVAFAVFGMGEPILFVRYGWAPAAFLLALRAQHLRATRETTRSRHQALVESR